ncbi:rhodanese-like domain-containing protein [Algoriphagus aestuarii]|nr:rhodanese-like domain-containing protein [Algoriphagus aestuarii]
MKTQIKIVLTFIYILFLISCSSKTSEPNTISVSPDELEKEILENKDLVILDVRTPEEFTEGHIKDAVLINFMGEDFQEKLENLDKTKTYAVYCMGGGRQQKSSLEMQNMGFGKILLLDGGFSNWTEEGKPIEK